MSFRFRRSKGLGKFARVTVSKTGIGMSVGATGARISKHTSGRTTRTVGVPGTGAYYRTDTMAGGKTRRSGSSSRTVSAPAAAAPARPGWFAPKAEKALHRAMRDGDVAALDAVAQAHPAYRRLAFSLAGALSTDDDPAGSVRRFEEARDPAWTAAEMRFVDRHLGHMVLEVNAAPGVDIGVPVTDLASVMCVSAAQDAGDHQLAADLADQLDMADIGYRVVAVAAHHNAGNDDRVIELTDGIANTGNATMLLLTLRAAAFRRQELLDASRETLREALKSKAREPGLRHMTLLERARTYAAQGRNAQARKDCETILAEDSTVDGLADLLDTLTDQT